jgi:hypothetical protein
MANWMIRWNFNKSSYSPGEQAFIGARADIEVWKISDIMSELIQEVGTKSYRDDVLRTVQLISRGVSNS